MECSNYSISRGDDSAETRELLPLVRLGAEHEMQHQELLVYDIKHLLCDLYEPTITRRPSFAPKL